MIRRFVHRLPQPLREAICSIWGHEHPTISPELEGVPLFTYCRRCNHTIRPQT